MIRLRGRFKFFKTVVVLVSVFIIILNPIAVLADPPGKGINAPSGIDAYSAYEEAKSWLYYNALAKCFDNHWWLVDDGDKISESDANNGVWLGDEGNPIGNDFGAERPSIGFFLTGSGQDDDITPIEKGLATKKYDRVRCGDAGGETINWILDAISLWGYSSGVEALCDFGAQRTNGSENCEEGGGWLTGNLYDVDWPGGDPIHYRRFDVNKFKDAVKNKVYNGQEPDISLPALYLLQLYSFNSGCLGSATPEVYTDTIEDDFYYEINVVNPLTGEGPAPTRYYSKIADHDESIYYKVDSSYRNVKNTCSELAGFINVNAPAFADYAKEKYATGGSAISDDNSSANAGTGSLSIITCAVDGAGWLVCPMIKLIAGISDAAYEKVSELLTTPPIINSSSSPGGGTDVYGAWSMMRNIANVAFVIAFLVIIFSQLTGAGVTNYGVKKILPRIIIAAILVNISYYVCAIGVDVSNIIGKSLSSLFESFGATLGPPQFDLTDSSTGDGWYGVAGWVLTGGITAGVTYFAGLAVLVPALFTVIIAIVTIFLTLAARQAIIMILIVISPLAFVAYLLPNTEQWFKKWGKMLGTLLALYPIIAVVFGGAAFASKIIMTSSSDKIIQIMGAVVGVVPLFMLPSLMKFGGNALGKLNGMIKGGAAGLSSPLQKRASEAYDNSKFEQFRNYRKNIATSRRGLIQSGEYSGKGGRLNPLNWASAVNRGVNSRTGKFGSRSIAAGKSIARGMLEEDIKAESSAMETMASDQITKIASGEVQASEAQRIAAIRQTMKVGNLEQRRAVYAGSNNASDLARASIRDGYFARSDHQIFGADLGDQLLSGGVTDTDPKVSELGLTKALTESVDMEQALVHGLRAQIVGGKISAATLASDVDVAKMITNSDNKYVLDSLSPDMRANLAKQAKAALALPGTSEKLTSVHRDKLSEIAKLS